MAETNYEPSGISVASLMAVGFLTDGDFLNFKSPFPQKKTELIGVEVAAHFGGPQFAAAYFKGESRQSLDGDDLPFPEKVIDLLGIEFHRTSESHFVLFEWRWPGFAPLATGRWIFLATRFGAGGGGFLIRTSIQNGDEEPLTVLAIGGIVTSSFRIQLFDFHARHFEISLEGAVRVFMGDAFGMTGETGLRLGYHF